MKPILPKNLQDGRVFPNARTLSRSTSSRSHALRSMVLRCTLFALTLHACATLAQPWQTVDDYQYAPGHWAVNFGLAVAPSGILFASGYAADTLGAGHGLVMASADGGNTWSAPLDDFYFSGGAVRDDGGIIADSAGNLYVAGRYYFSSGPSYRFVRRSTDGGATWATVDNVALSGSYAFPLAATQIGADSAGNVYVTEPNGTWTIRKGIGGTNFSTVDTFQPSTANANAVFAHPTAGVFAAGYGPGGWLVRLSRDGGVTWSTVDTYASGYAAYGIGADRKGNIYVVGDACLPSKHNNSCKYWVVRKSGDGGATWNTVDAYQFSTAGIQRALGFAADSLGNLYVAGYATASTTGGPFYWIVRENPGGTGTWTTVDNFPYTSGAEAHAIAADSLGNVFAGGQVSSSGGTHWVVRKN